MSSLAGRSIQKFAGSAAFAENEKTRVVASFALHEHENPRSHSPRGSESIRSR
jgi:hypothetical protein